MIEEDGSISAQGFGVEVVMNAYRGRNSGHIDICATPRA